MSIVKGIYKGKSVELLEPVNIKEGTEVEVVFPDTEEKKTSFVNAMHQELDRMNKGFSLGSGPYYQNRSELYER